MWTRMAAATALGLACMICESQSLPADRTAGQLTPRSLAPQPRSDKDSPPPELPPVPAPEGADQLFVTPGRITITNGFASLDVLARELTDRFEGRRISVAQFYALAAAVQSRYAAAGYPLVRVGVPPQELRDGETATLEVLDGFIEGLELEGVADALVDPLQEILRPLIGKRRLTAAELERRLALIEDLPGAAVRSMLVPGLEPGGVKLVVDAQHRVFNAGLSLDNRGSDSLGERQMSGNLSFNSPFGWGEQFFVSFGGDLSRGISLHKETPPRRLLGAGLLLGLGHDGWRAGVEVARSTTASGGVLETTSLFKRLQFSLSYPLLRGHDRSLVGKLLHERQSEVRDVPLFEFRLAADAWTLTRASLEGGLRLGSAAVNGSATFTQGRYRGDVTEGARLDATARFAKLEFGASANAPLGRWFGMLQVRAQLVTDGTPPLSETMSLEGRDSLPNQSRSSMTADNAVSTRLSLVRPIAVDWAPGWSVAPGVHAAYAIAKAMPGFTGQATRASALGVGVDLRPAPARYLPQSQLSLQYSHLHRNGAEPGGGRWLVDLSLAY